MSDDVAKNLAYQLFRLMGNWMSRQCYEVNPTYTREDLLCDLEKNIRQAISAENKHEHSSRPD